MLAVPRSRAGLAGCPAPELLFDLVRGHFFELGQQLIELAEILLAAGDKGQARQALERFQEIKKRAEQQPPPPS